MTRYNLHQRKAKKQELKYGDKNNKNKDGLVWFGSGSFFMTKIKKHIWIMVWFGSGSFFMTKIKKHIWIMYRIIEWVIQPWKA